MKALKIRFFSLVEVAIAVGILALGAIAVVTLMPTGLKQKKDALGENYAGIFQGDATAYFSALSRTKFSDLLTLPHYNDVFTQNSTTKDIITGAVKGKQIGTDFYGTNVNGVYIISKSSGSVEDYAGQVVVWQDTPRSMDLLTLAPKKVNPSYIPQNFIISGGTVSNTSPVDVEPVFLGSQWGTNWPTYFKMTITEPGKTPYDYYPFGNGTELKGTTKLVTNAKLPNLPLGTKVVAEASGHMPSPYNKDCVSTSSNTANVITLKNGDAIPKIAPWSGQKSAAALVSKYVSDDGKKIVLEDHQVIYLFELDGMVKDYQDLVVLTNVIPEDPHDFQGINSGIGISASDTFNLTYLLNGNPITLTSAISSNTFPTGSGLTENSFVSADGTGGVTFDVNNMNMNLNGICNLTVDGNVINFQGQPVTLNPQTPGSMTIRLYKTNKGGQLKVIFNPSKVTIYSQNINVPPPPPPIVETDPRAIGLNVEISWPLSQQDYSKREKVRFYSEYYNMPKISK
ncbi:MAG: hypothetical protein WCR55_12460 [Lentisphaerota bacterium]